MARSPKDAIVLCLDVGPGMTQSPPDEDSPLESSRKIIQLMVQRKIFSQSKDEISLVLFGTEDTRNDLSDGENYNHITVLNLLSVPDFDLLETISKIEPGPEEADFLDAVTVGLDILHKQTKGKKIAERRLVLFTNFDHGFSTDSLEGIMGGFSCENEEVQFNVIAPKFEEPLENSDEEESGSDGEGPSVKKQRTDKENHFHPQKPKTAQQRAGERVISQIFKEGDMDGCVYTYDQAVVALTYFEKKSVRPTPWKCNLELGTEFSIPCTAYVKCKAETLKKSWVKCYAKTHKPEDVTVQKYHHLQDEQHTEVDKENIIKGYRYGKDVIPFSKEDEEQMKYKTEGKRLAILGFTESKNVQPQIVMDDQAYIIKTEPGDEHAATALASLATAMHSLKMCAIARYVNRKGSNPKIAALLPRIKDTYRCLVMVYLPYAEDLRSLDFPSLVSHNSTGPSSEQLSAVDSLIASMGLCAGEKELFKSQQMPNPYFQRVYHSLNHRALNPNETLPPSNEQIDNILARDPQVIQGSSATAMLVENCFKLEKMEVKTKKLQKQDGEEKSVQIKSENGSAASKLLSISDQLASKEEVKSVGSVTPVQDFITLLKNMSNPRTVFEQLQQRILELVLDTSNAENRTVISCLRIMEEKASATNQINLFNSFLKNLKSTLKDDSPDNFYWKEIVSKEITLIGCDEVSEKEVDSFLS